MDTHTSQPPKPSLPYLVCSVVVIGVCIFLISTAIAGIATLGDPCGVIGGCIQLPLPTIVLVQQYRATFRHNRTAALTCAVCLVLVGGVALFGLMATVVALLGTAIRMRQIPLVPLLVMATIATFTCLSAWLNWQWSRRLKLYVRSPEDDVNPNRFSMRELLALVTVVSCTAALSTYFIRSENSGRPRHAEHVSRDDAPFDLPEGARDISYCQGFRGTIVYEFTIDEPGFIAWVEAGIGSPESDAAGIQLQPIVGIHHIHSFRTLLPGGGNSEPVTITDGLFYEWHHEDRGVHAAFDRSNNRAYYDAHYH